DVECVQVETFERIGKREQRTDFVNAAERSAAGQGNADFRRVRVRRASAAHDAAHSPFTHVSSHSVVGKSPWTSSFQGLSACSQVYWNQRFDVALVARFMRLPTLRAAFVVDLRASFAWRCAGAFAASGENFGSD